MDWISFWIAITGVVLAVVSLGLQVYTWRATGPKVRVSIDRYWMFTPGKARERFIGVTERNVGGSAVGVTSWGITLPDIGDGDAHLVMPFHDPIFGPAPPRRLEARQKGGLADWR